MANRQKTYTFRGKTQSLPRWASELGVSESTLRSRLGKLGQSVEESFGRPADARFKPAAGAGSSSPPSSPTIPPPPKLERHVSGAGRVRWTEFGRRREKFLPVFGTAECTEAYLTFCREWYAQRGRPAPPAGESVTVAGLIVRYVEFAESHFRKHGRMTSEVHGVRAALTRVNLTYGKDTADTFTPSKLRTVIDGMVREGLARKTINDYRDRVVRCFRWAVSHSLVPPAVADALEAVERLVAGRTEAAESAKVGSAPPGDVAKVLEYLHGDPAKNAVLKSLVLVLRHTGMRPGEACSLRVGEVDRSREPWLYRPVSKTLHLDRDRKVWIGPRGREVLGPMIDAVGSVAGGGGASTACGFVFVLPKYRGEGTVRVSEKFLRERVAAACERARVPVFTPNQIRHTKATEVHERYEDDAAVAAALGNSAEVARQVYVDSPRDAVAKRVAEELG